MKKTKLYATIAVIVGEILTTTSILVNKYGKEKEKDSGINHEPAEVDKCKSISLEEKNTFIIKKAATTEEDKKSSYKLLTIDEDFSNLLNEYEQNNEELQLNFTNYDYLVYFMYENNTCDKTNYLTDYNLNGNALNIEFTKSEFNKAECDEESVYGYGIAIEKNKFVEGQTNIEIINKEDPFKDCYK